MFHISTESIIPKPIIMASDGGPIQYVNPTGVRYPFIFDESLTIGCKNEMVSEHGFTCDAQRVGFVNLDADAVDGFRFG